MKKIVLLSIILLSTFLVVLPTTRVSAVEFAQEGPGYFVVFSGQNLPAYADAIITGCGGRVSSKFPNVGVLVALPTIDPAAFEANLNGIPSIIDFGHDYISELPDDLIAVSEESELEGTPPDPTPVDLHYWRYQWHMWHTIQASNTSAWTITTGSHNIKVAVLDTGIDWTHPDLAPNYDSALSKNFVDWDFDGIPDEPLMDENGHGSFCGGIVAAAYDGGRCVGVGPNLGLVNLKVMGREGRGYFEWDFGAIYWAVQNGINVVSMSFGAYVPMAGGAKQGGSALYSALQRLFNYANLNGVLCIASAGNSALDMDGLWSWRHLPSQCSNVICVIGTDVYDGLAAYSNYGSCLHGISAPGGYNALIEPAWYRTEFPNQPKVAWNYLMGWIFSTGLMANYPYIYLRGYGTSMSAPHVAGVAGLILSINPELEPSMVRHFLNKGAKDIGAPGYDQYFNFGLLNAYKSVSLAATSRIRIR